jgi:hypothetical protein
MMLTIGWNPLGFHVLNSLPKGRTCNAEDYRDNILTALLPLRPLVDGRRLMIHADNARPHTSQKCRTVCAENGLRLASHLPYSPDLAPWDFFLFGYDKNCLEGASFQSPEEIFAAIAERVTAIPGDTLHSVFEDWMEILEWVSRNNGDYYP